MAENRVDPTVAGLFLVGLVTLLFGLLGLDIYGGAGIAYLEYAAAFIPIVGIVLIIFAYMAGKVGNAFATALFAFIAVALYGVLVFGAAALTPGEVGYAAGFYILALFFLIFAIVSFLIGAPKLLGFLLVVVAFLYLFVGFFFADGSVVLALAFGIFGLVAFLISTYLAVALATQKLPVF